MKRYWIYLIGFATNNGKMYYEYQKKQIHNFRMLQVYNSVNSNINFTWIKDKDTKKETCNICGSSFNQNKYGRPKEHCSPECTNLNKFFNAMENSALKVNFSTDKLKQFKGDLFRVANELTSHSRNKAG